MKFIFSDGKRSFQRKELHLDEPRFDEFWDHYYRHLTMFRLLISTQENIFRSEFRRLIEKA